MSDEIALGRKLRELREAADISLRELARGVDVSAPFLSDVELGRRYPSDEILTKLAKKLGVRLAELKQLDTRGTVGDLKRMIEASPSLGFAFRSMVDHVNTGKLSSDEIAAKLKEFYGPKSK